MSLSCIQAFSSSWSWEAFGAISTLLAVVVALFQDKFWNWWNKPNPEIVVVHQREIPAGKSDHTLPRLNPRQHESFVTLAVRNSGRVIEDAKVYWVASEWNDRSTKTRSWERVFPERRFDWSARVINQLDFKSVKLYGEEIFDFLRAEKESTGHWKPGLAIPDSMNERPFKEFVNDPPNSSRDPNFEITVYLQIKGSNFISDYWPVWLRHDPTTVGGWVVQPKKKITVKQFFKLFPNETERHFKATSERLK